MNLGQIVRVLAVISLLIASLCVIGNNSPYCLYEYAGLNAIWRTDTFFTGISDDPAMFTISAGIGLLFFIPLLLSCRRGWYVFFFVILNLVQIVFLSYAILSPSVVGLIYDSIVYCHNYGLLAWLIGELLFTIFSLIFIFHEFNK